jgi:hypothetical protein
VINMTLTGWEAPEGYSGWQGFKDCPAPAFPEDGKPSMRLALNVKRELVEWYLNQFTLGEDTQKI